MNYREKVEEKRKAIVDTLIKFIETKPEQWEAGWYSMPSEAPFNGRTQKKYKGLNSFYLAVIASIKGYTDPRWITFNQAKELGAHIKSGEKSSEVMYWSWYDKATKKPFDEKALDGMEYDERQKYIEENVRPVLKFYQVFNAQQCENMPVYDIGQTPEMAAEERARQNALIERVIANSEAPVLYDGGSRAYYAPLTDSIHLPEIKAFKTMQDYYATALHEIAHSTGHESRLNRNILNAFGTADYAKEELRAELASVFMQTELGISVEGRHFENHGAYLASWLKSVKDNPKEFYAAASDAERISDYVAENYLKERTEESAKSEIEMRVEEVERRISEIELDRHAPQIQAMTMMIAADADESGAEYKPEYQAALRKIDYDMAVARLICYGNHSDKEKRFERDEQRTLLRAKILGEYLSGAGIVTLPDDVRAAHTDYVLSEVDSAYANEVGAIYNEMQREAENRLEVQADRVAGARAAMYASVQNENVAVYAVRVEKVPDIDEFDGRETEVERKVPYIINNNGEIESWGTCSLDAQDYEIISTLPYARQRDYREVSYAELEATAEAKAAPIKAYADALKEFDRLSGKPLRNDYFYRRSAEEALEEYRVSMQETKFRSDEIVDEASNGKAQTENGIYGIIYDWKGLKEENSLYTEEELKRLDEDFVPEERYDGAIAANKTYMAIRLTGNTPEETDNNVREFLTGKYNEAADMPSVDGWYWETVEENFFTGEKNETTLAYIKKLNIPASELRMQETTEESSTEKGTPLYREYMNIQTAYPDATVVKRIGDFYEVLGDKAVNAADRLDLTLTSRDVGLDERVPMIGFPYHTSEQYIAKMREYGAVVVDGENGNEYLPQTEATSGSERSSSRPGQMSLFEDEQAELVEQVGQAGQAEKKEETLGDWLNGTVEQQRAARRALGDKQAGQGQQAELVGQVEQAEQAEQAQQSDKIDFSKKWLPIELSPEQIGEASGQSTLIRMPQGEYSSFVFFVPTKLLRHDEKSGKVKVSVNVDYKYNLIHDGLQVELTGMELRGALAGKEIGKSAQRVSASRMNKRRLSALAENVPDEMRLMPNWCAYKTRWNNEKGKKDKFVLSPVDGKWAKSSDPATWTDFETAMEFAKRNNCEGLAFALDGKSGISCIDLDHSIGEGGELSAPAKRLTDEISDTYIEISVSGNGIHIFVKEDILGKGKYKNRAVTSEGEIEVYDTGRFISMTGNIRSKTTQLGKCPVATAQWLRGTLGEKVQEQQRQPRPRSVGGMDRSDEAVIERIRKSKRGGEFDALFRGEDLTGDNSRNDFKMMNMLAFFTDCDTAQMERIFKSSGLYRPEKGQPYVTRSIEKACSTLTTRMSDRAFGGGKSQARGNVK